MSNRAIRRAAERANNKTASRNAQPATKPLVMTASVGDTSHQPTPPNVDFEPSSNRPITDAQLNANRENAQKSCGPTSPDGKAKSSLNALKTGLTGRTILLPTDDIDAYQQLVARTFTDLAPESDRERAIAQIIADTDWRLLRIAPLEASLWAVGFRKLGDLYPEETDPANRTALIQGEVFTFYRRDFSNIALQERRLRSQRNADLAELLALRQQRAEKAEQARVQRIKEVSRAELIVKNGRIQQIPFDFAEFGFDFSLAELLAYKDRSFPHGLLTGLPLDFDKFLTTHRKEQTAA